MPIYSIELYLSLDKQDNCLVNHIWCTYTYFLSHLPLLCHYKHDIFQYRGNSDNLLLLFY